MQKTAIGDIPPAAPTAEEGREIKTPRRQREVQWEMEGTKAEGTPFPEGHTDAPEERNTEGAGAGSAGGGEAGGKKGTQSK